MANHTITVRNVNGGGSQDDGTGVKKVSKGFKKTSAREKFENNKVGGSVLKGIRVGRTLNVGAGLGMLGGGASMAAAVAQEIGGVAMQGTNVYSNFMEAKSGESMKYHNMRQSVRRIAQPFSYLKQAIWDYGIIAPMQINRQNQMLEYNRHLTGNLVHSKIYQNDNI